LYRYAMAVARVLSEATAATREAREAEGVSVRFASCRLPPAAAGVAGGAAATGGAAGFMDHDQGGARVVQPSTGTAIIKGEDSW
jgi:hypothetical protein